MSQDLRDYDLFRVDKNDAEAGNMSVTATVGPTGHGVIDDTRSVQITLDTPNGTAYGRVSEPQIRDLIDVLEARIDPDKKPEATGWEWERTEIAKDGSVEQ